MNNLFKKNNYRNGTSVVKKIRRPCEYTFKAKTQKNKPTKYTNNRVSTYEHSPKTAKYNNTKNCIIDLAITNAKKKQDIADKSADTKTYCRQNDLHSQSFNLQSKGHNTARCDYKPGQRRSPTEKSQLPINLF